MNPLRYVDEFRSPDLARAVAAAVAREAAGLDLTFMEVCGTHTMAAARHGLRELLPKNVRLISGPGCPVCVTPLSYLDRAMALCRRPDVTVVTFGDMMRVPGSRSSLERERAAGADVRVVYSPIEALKIAREDPGRSVVFLAVGFETTAPAVAATLQEAARAEIGNLLFLMGHKTIPPAMRALAEAPDLRINGFLCPGHVSTIIGSGAYAEIARRARTPCVVAGFEPLDILQGILMLVRQARQKRAVAENQYARAVSPNGNARARQVMAETFRPVESEWRGLGAIPASGLALNPGLERFDAARIDVRVEPEIQPEGCLCGMILRGVRSPRDCGLFGTACTPATPVGACMVSSEGACAAHYRYPQA